MKKLKNKDKVMMMKGKYKGKISEVIKVFPSTDKALVAKVAMVKRHAKATQNTPGGIQEKERPVSCSSLKLICPRCNEPSRWVLKTSKTARCVFARNAEK